MIAQEEDNLLVQTNRGTPCGELIVFVVQSLSDLPLMGEPLAAAYQVLLKSIEDASVRPATGQG